MRTTTTAGPQLGRRELAEAILVAAQKARSNLLETFGGDQIAERLLAELDPHLSAGAELNLVEACMQVLAKETVETIDIVNLLVLVRRTPAVEIALAFAGVQVPSFQALHALPA